MHSVYICIFMIKISGVPKGGGGPPREAQKMGDNYAYLHIQGLYVSRFAIELKLPGVNKHDLS